MKRVPVTSSAIVSLGWDDGVLEVEFKPGHNGRPKVFRYSRVTLSEFEVLMSGVVSIGAEVSKIARNPSITMERVFEEVADQAAS